jgi:hypothetical protein
MDIFVSVGTGLNTEQEAFVGAVEARLRALGLTPHTIGRNAFSADSPLHAVADLMDRCAGAVVIAVERFYFSDGIERRGSLQERPLGAVGLPTPWNQIEAAFAYSRGLPLLVLVDESLRCDGLLEKGNDWCVQKLAINPNSLSSAEFAGVMDDWRDRVSRRLNSVAVGPVSETKVDLANMSVAQLVAALKPAQIWASLVALAGLIGAAFTIGVKLAHALGYDK